MRPIVEVGAESWLIGALYQISLRSSFIKLILRFSTDSLRRLGKYGSTHQTKN